jgi:hypothetical protein
VSNRLIRSVPETSESPSREGISGVVTYFLFSQQAAIDKTVKFRRGIGRPSHTGIMLQPAIGFSSAASCHSNRQTARALNGIFETV